LKNHHLRTLEKESRELEITINRSDVKLDNMLEILSRDYELTYERAKSEYILDIEPEDARLKVNTYKANIKRIGMVNLDSIEEYERVNTRYIFLTNQREDLLNAEGTLLEIMNEMDDVMKEEFLRTFEQIMEEIPEEYRIDVDEIEERDNVDNIEDDIGALEYEIDNVDRILSKLTLIEDISMINLIKEFGIENILNKEEKENDLLRFLLTNGYISEDYEEYINYYAEKNNISAKEKAALVSKNYVYGYIENIPYEKTQNGKIVGIAGEYLNRLTRLADIHFELKKFDSKKELNEAVEKGEVDVYFDYYNFGGDQYLETLSTFIEDYVIIGKQKFNHIVNSFESLKGKDLVMLKDKSLYSYFSNNSRANIKGYENLDKLLENAKDKLIALDYELYCYYQNSKFKDYNFLYRDTMMNDYKFMVKKDNEAFYNLFNYIINTNSYYNYRNNGLQALNSSILKDSTLEQAYMIVLTIIFLPLGIVGIFYLILKKKKQVKKIKISDRQKYTDMLTSLKNRNYLNAKIPEWEDTQVFPQSIVVVDLNSVKYVNDNYGHEEGDQLIIKAAGILVNTQLENSEIIRTDGNEFLIYLVGYSERQINTYTKKLSKEMKTLPYEFGAAVGYSMINDEIKTIDDAINEATIEMIANKEEYK